MDREITQCEVLKNSFELINYFYTIIGDGDNPTQLKLRYNLEKRITEDEIFIYQSGDNIGSRFFFEKNIKSTKKVIENPIEQIKKLVEWNKGHALNFTGCKIINTQHYRILELEEMLGNVVGEFDILIKNWQVECSEYLIDTKDNSHRRFLFIHGIEKSILAEFRNHVH